MRSPLRVAINVRSLIPGKIGGVERAFRDTLDCMLARGGEQLQVTLLASAHSQAAFVELAGRVSVRLVRADGGDQALAQAVAEHDVLWCPLFFLEPLRPPIPAVAFIPDLQHQTYPEYFPRDSLTMRVRALRGTTGLAQRVFVPSEFTKQQIVRAYGVMASRVVVVPHDCGPEFRQAPDRVRQLEVQRRYGLDPGYLLYPANAWPHKNHIGLLRALARYRARFGPPPPLVLTGVADLGTDIAQECAALDLAASVKHLGFVPAADLPHLYDGAAMLVFPSLFEGFGIPLVEALRRGTPIVASTATSVPEVTGPHALLVDPRDPDAWASAIRETLTNAADARARAARGRQWAERYGYDRAAELTLATLREVAASPESTGSGIDPGWRPKVFVVTPSYNQGQFLRATIDSVLAQDYPNLDYFVADGGSTDDSVAVLRSYGDRVRWVSQPDGGQAAAIAAAWQSSDAEIVAWLNSDDTYLEGAVTAAVEFLRSNPDVHMVYAEGWYTDAEGRPTEPYPTFKPFRRETLARNCFICQPTVFVRREVFQVIDLPDPALRYSMDYDLWIRLSERFGVGYLDRFLATSRLHEATKTLSQRDGVYREVMLVTKRHFGYVHREWLTGWVYHKSRKLLNRHPWLMPGPVRQVLVALLQRKHRRSVPAPPYDDGWVGLATTLTIEPGEDGQVEIVGDSPAWPHRKPLVVKALLDGKTLLRHVVRDRGRFALRFRVQQRRVVPAVVTLQASDTFVPSDLGQPGDPRAVAFRIVEVAGRGRAASAARPSSAC